MTGIAIGSLDFPKIGLGSTEVVKVSLGDVLVWPAGVSGGVDLGTERVEGSDSDGTNRSASGSVVFSTTGTVTLSATTSSGGTSSTTAPAANWNVGGGTHISFEYIRNTVVNSGSFLPPAGVQESNPEGNNRVGIAQYGNMTFQGSVIYSAGEPDGGEVDVQIKISIWNGATGLTRTAFGIYEFNFAV